MIKRTLFFGLALSIFSVQALEPKTKDFFLCFQKTAPRVQSRTVRIHQFPDEKKCLVIYSVKGKDQIISQGGWMTFCEKKAKQVVDNLTKGLWQCRKENQIEVFFPFPSSQG